MSTTPATELLASVDSSTLLTSLLTLDALETPTSDERMAKAWVCDELERRYPAVNAATLAWADDLETDLTYVQALVAALPAEVTS